MKGLILRQAEFKDIPGIRRLVAELASYENARSEFVCDSKRYETLYKERIWDAIVACQKDDIIGVCIYYYGFSTWKGKFLYLEDFIVAESNRRKGTGRALFDHLCEIAVANDCELMRWQVLDWNRPAISFYEKYEVSIEGEWLNCRLMLT